MTVPMFMFCVFIFLTDVLVCFKPSGFVTFFHKEHVCNIAFCVPLKTNNKQTRRS